MDNKIREAFDVIRAEDNLKQNTKEFLRKQLYVKENGKAKSFYAKSRQLSAVAACFMVVVAGIGYFSYFQTVSAISIDVNPSIELGINRIDRVVSVEGYNEDGIRLAKQLDVRFMEYTEAVETILEDEVIAEYLNKDEQLSITVLGDDNKSQEMLSNVNSCVKKHKNVHCHSSNFVEAEEAHRHGLSFGKYKEFLELQELDSNITVEDVQGLTMREIRTWIEELSGEDKNSNGAGIGNGEGNSKHDGQKHHGKHRCE